MRAFMAEIRTLLAATVIRPAKMGMMVITTNNSISVKLLRMRKPQGEPEA